MNDEKSLPAMPDLGLPGVVVRQFDPRRGWDSVFGMAHTKREGGPGHPDDVCGDNVSDEVYLRQLQAYKDANPGAQDYKSCVRDHLLQDLK
jgi:hypothetical protein